MPRRCAWIKRIRFCPTLFLSPEHRPRAHAKYMLAVPDHIMISESVTVNVAKNTVFSRFPFCCNRHGKAVWTLSITGKAAYLVYLILSSKFSPTMCLLEDWCNVCGCQQLLKDLGKIQRFRWVRPPPPTFTTRPLPLQCQYALHRRRPGSWKFLSTQIIQCRNWSAAYSTLRTRTT